jgi:hypothetical protein
VSEYACAITTASLTRLRGSYGCIEVYTVLLSVTTKATRNSLFCDSNSLLYVSYMYSNRKHKGSYINSPHTSIHIFPKHSTKGIHTTATPKKKSPRSNKYQREEHKSSPFDTIFYTPNFRPNISLATLSFQLPTYSKQQE